jgi:anti-anti-sigma factor
VGNVTEHDARLLRQRVLDALLEGRRAIAFDLARAQSFDSGALGILVSITRRVNEAQGTTEFENVNEQTRLLFEMMRLEHLFVIRDPQRARSRRTPSSSAVIPANRRRP